MTDPAYPALVPLVKATWTCSYKSVTTTFRIVSNNSASGGTYTIETRETDATGKAAWSEFLTFTTSTPDRTATKLTPITLTAMMDAIFA